MFQHNIKDTTLIAVGKGKSAFKPSHPHLVIYTRKILRRSENSKFSTIPSAVNCPSLHREANGFDLDYREIFIFIETFSPPLDMVTGVLKTCYR